MYAWHNFWQVNLVIHFTKTYKYYTLNTNIVKITNGINMKKDLGKVIIKCIGLAKKGSHVKFIEPLLNLGND